MSSLLGVPHRRSGYLILDWLAAAGWTLTIVAGDRGVKATATFGALVVEAEGKELAEVALVLHAACRRPAIAEGESSEPRRAGGSL